MYVDHAATTPVRPEVLAAMLPFFSQEWGNPSSLYGPGRRAAHAVNHARDTVADIKTETPGEIAVSVGAELLKARRGGDAASISDVLRPQYRYSLTKGDQDI
jgi:selenocysteine lyase/cysteine desulfurase